jgi:hypothetical protein
MPQAHGRAHHCNYNHIAACLQAHNLHLPPKIGPYATNTSPATPVAIMAGSCQPTSSIPHQTPQPFATVTPWLHPPFEDTIVLRSRPASPTCSLHSSPPPTPQSAARHQAQRGPPAVILNARIQRGAARLHRRFQGAVHAGGADAWSMSFLPLAAPAARSQQLPRGGRVGKAACVKPRTTCQS